MLANTTRALTEEQREQWAVDGYLQLEGALSPAEVDFFSAQLDRVRTLPGYEPAPRHSGRAAACPAPARSPAGCARGRAARRRNRPRPG